jgi:PRTRC genetic system ThiF family protein
MGLPYLDQALRVWGRFAGLDVVLMDADTVSETNCIRQPFSISDIGLSKATVLVNRINLFWGTNWKAEPRNFDERTFERIQDTSIDFLIGCADSRTARSTIAQSLVKTNNRTAYWLDLGNNSASGQGAIIERPGDLPGLFFGTTDLSYSLVSYILVRCWKE